MALQDHSFSKSQYERPNQDWVCGWAKDGWNCPLGPGPQGACRSTSECFPIKKGDQWCCTRPEHRGGPCREGPLPDGQCSTPIPVCQPALSLRKRRGRVSLWTVVTTVGLLLLVLPDPSGRLLLSPGQVNSAHGTLGNNCEVCHANSSERLQEILFGEHSHTNLESDSHRCLTCHQFGVNEMEVHNQSPTSLEALTKGKKKIQTSSSPPVALRVLNWLPKGLISPSQPNACGICHQEHQGKHANLRAMDAQACQTCHSIQFSSFADGHPALGPYPYRRRTRIAFDHSSHTGKHFPEKDRHNHYGTCESCHTPDQTSQTMLTKNFQTSCAECHTQELKGIGNESSLVFFRVPEIDYDTLGMPRIGDWPEDLQGELALEQDVTPFMRLLLEADSSSTHHLAQQRLAIVKGDFSIIHNYGHLYDLANADPEVLDAAERIIWAIKNLLLELSTQGQQAMIVRLRGKTITAALGRVLYNDEVSTLAAQLPIGVIQTAQKKWFPRLDEEVMRRREQTQMNHVSNSELSLQSKKISSRKGQVIREFESTRSSTKIFAQEKASFSDKQSIGSVVEGHRSQMKGALDKDQDLVQFVEKANQEEILDLEILAGDSMKEEPELSILESDNTSLLSEEISTDEILDDDRPSSLLSEERGSASSERLQTEDNEQEIEEIDPTEIQERDKNREEGVLTGGWYHSNMDFSVKFRRTGHEDRLSYAWLNIANLLSTTDMNRSGDQLLSYLTLKHGSGSCIRCHSLDLDVTRKEGSPSQAVNWSSARPILPHRQSTHFSHAPHLSLVSKKTKCQTCHILKENQEKDWVKTWYRQNMNPFKYSSNFKFIPKKTCVTCHHEDSAGENCLVCHNYHIQVNTTKGSTVSQKFH